MSPASTAHSPSPAPLPGPAPEPRTPRLHRVEPSLAPQPQVGRHHPATIALHWFSALAIVVCAGAGLARELTENDALRNGLLDLHRQAGLAVLLALGARLAVRWRHRMADHAGPQPRLLRWAALGAHLALYAMLLALPVLGLATSQAHEVTVRLFGVLPIPAFVPADPDLADTLSDWHINLSWGLLALLAAHIGAALWHHLRRRDGVLLAMLPLQHRRKPR